MAGRNIAYVKPPEPSFLRELKLKVGYKEGPNVDTKREELPRDASSDDDNDDEAPIVVQLKPGDLSAEEAKKVKEESSEDDNDETDFSDGRIIFKKPCKRSEDSEQQPVAAKKPKREHLDKPLSQSKKVKNKSLLSFDEEDNDD